MTVLAGSGVAGFADGQGVLAKFNYIQGIVIHRQSGSLYIADSSNHRIRVCTAQGFVTTLAGSGTAGNSNGAALTSKFNTPTGIVMDNALNYLYVTCRYGNTLRQVLVSTGFVSTFAGNGLTAEVDGAGLTASFNGPTYEDCIVIVFYIISTISHSYRVSGLAWAVTGDLLVADYGGNRIRLVNFPGAVVWSYIIYVPLSTWFCF